MIDIAVNQTKTTMFSPQLILLWLHDIQKLLEQLVEKTEHYFSSCYYTFVIASCAKKSALSLLTTSTLIALIFVSQNNYVQLC